MKLRKIDFINHNVLGDLEIDFCVDGAPSSTILIAGENGTGKTSILNSIYQLSQIQPNLVTDGEKITYSISLSPIERELISKHPNSTLLNNQIIDSDIEIEIIGQGRKDWNRVKTRGSFQGRSINMPGHLLADAEIKNKLRLLYSNVAINFSPNDISTVTARNIDENLSSQVTNVNSATELTQLLIDIQALDDADLSSWVRENRGVVVDEGVLDKRISRFQQAFSLMLPEKKYKEIKNHNSQKKVVFTENGKECFIEDLSSGEKQIIFRGGFFLKDTGATQEKIGIIDEPEISLHPSWQLKILEFYKTILGVDNVDSHSQLIVATHSPFILHNYDRSNDKIIVLKKNEQGNLEICDTPSFYGWTNEEAINKAFSVSLNTAIEKPLVLVEGITDEKYINAAIELLDFDLKDVEVKWVGRISESGNAEFTGDKALNHTFSFARSNPNLIKRAIILLYDSDTNKPEVTYGNLFVRTMPFSTSNSIIKKGIENLLNIHDDFDMAPFVDENIKIDDYGISNVIRKLNKNKLCNHIIKNSKDSNHIDMFLNFKTLLEKINKTVDNA